MLVAPNGFLLCTDYGRQVLYHGHRLEESRICPIAERSTTHHADATANGVILFLTSTLIQPIMSPAYDDVDVT